MLWEFQAVGYGREGQEGQCYHKRLISKCFCPTIFFPVYWFSFHYKVFFKVLSSLVSLFLFGWLFEYPLLDSVSEVEDKYETSDFAFSVQLVIVRMRT